MISKPRRFETGYPVSHLLCYDHDNQNRRQNGVPFLLFFGLMSKKLI